MNFLLRLNLLQRMAFISTVLTFLFLCCLFFLPQSIQANHGSVVQAIQHQSLLMQRLNKSLAQIDNAYHNHNTQNIAEAKTALQEDMVDMDKTFTVLKDGGSLSLSEEKIFVEALSSKAKNLLQDMEVLWQDDRQQLDQLIRSIKPVGMDDSQLNQVSIVFDEHGKTFMHHADQMSAMFSGSLNTSSAKGVLLSLSLMSAFVALFSVSRLCFAMPAQRRSTRKPIQEDKSRTIQSTINPQATTLAKTAVYSTKPTFQAAVDVSETTNATIQPASTDTTISLKVKNPVSLAEATSVKPSPKDDEPIANPFARPANTPKTLSYGHSIPKDYHHDDAWQDQDYCRFAYQTAEEQNKSILVGCKGFDTFSGNQQQQQILKKLLQQMITHHITHSIETPQERHNANKNQQGRLRITLTREGNQARLVVEDDGRGIDFDRIRHQAMKSKIQGAGQMNKQELMMLLFNHQVHETANPELIQIRDYVHDLYGKLNIAPAENYTRFSIVFPILFQIGLRSQKLNLRN